MHIQKDQKKARRRQMDRLAGSPEGENLRDQTHAKYPGTWSVARPGPLAQRLCSLSSLHPTLGFGVPPTASDSKTQQAQPRHTHEQARAAGTSSRHGVTATYYVVPLPRPPFSLFFWGGRGVLFYAAAFFDLLSAYRIWRHFCTLPIIIRSPNKYKALARIAALVAHLLSCFFSSSPPFFQICSRRVAYLSLSLLHASSIVEDPLGRCASSPFPLSLRHLHRRISPGPRLLGDLTLTNTDISLYHHIRRDPWLQRTPNHLEPWPLQFPQRRQNKPPSATSVPVPLDIRPNLVHQRPQPCFSRFLSDGLQPTDAHTALHPRIRSGSTLDSRAALSLSPCVSFIKLDYHYKRILACSAAYLFLAICLISRPSPSSFHPRQLLPLQPRPRLPSIVSNKEYLAIYRFQEQHIEKSSQNRNEQPQPYLFSPINNINTNTMNAPVTSPSQQQAHASVPWAQQQTIQRAAVPPPPPRNVSNPPSTDAFLKDFTLVAEAAKRAQMAVMIRDLENIGL